jgi:hypothetical protein
MEFLSWLENTNFSIWVRESGSLFAFPGILLVHTYGMALVVGIVAAIDLRILGFAPALPLSTIAKFLPIFWVAFWINALTGTILLVADATTKMTNPDFFIKMGFIALAVVNQRMIQQKVLGQPTVDTAPFSGQAKLLAVTSMLFWFAAITAGRLLAYVGPVSGLK